MTARRSAEAATNRERDPIADILRDLDRVRAEAREAVQADDVAEEARKGRRAGVLARLRAALRGE